MFKTIRSTSTAVISAAISCVAIAILLLATIVHENLYKSTAAQDLNGLSLNIADDLVPYLANESSDIFGVTTTLLRLDRYDNVKYAIVLDDKNHIVQTFTGSAASEFAENMQDTFSKYLPITSSFDEVHTATNNLSKRYGTRIANQELVAFHSIGNLDSPLGSLLIVNDIQGPLADTRKALLATAFPLTLAILALGIFVSLWLNSRLLLPFRKLANLAKQIKETKDYSTNIQLGGKKEVRTLSYAFDDMMKTIFVEEQKNKEYTKTLKQQRAKIEKVANFDELTGLANRHYFATLLSEKLSKIKLNNQSCALLYIDLDGFKSINDNYGHHVGDLLLRQATARMLDVFEGKGTLCRFGGDEFLYLACEDASYEEIELISNKLIGLLNVPYSIEQWEIETGASVGVTYAEDANYDRELLISNADMAMYEAKERGKNNTVMFNETMVEKNQRRILIANSLLSAIRNNELQLHYQGKVNKDHKVVGFEGLVRWIHPTLGFIAPDEFIGIAEKSGRITDITFFVIEQACKDIHHLTSMFGENLVLSINLSSNDLNQADLSDKIKNFFTCYQVNPRNMEFEVTESAYLENFKTAQEFFDELSAIGCTIALDDFGTGYSSLSYLTKINIDTLKIDKQFIQQYGESKKDTLVTKSIIHLAKQLDLNICAEGVETLTQAEALFEEGCQQLQGFYFYKPVALSQLIENSKAKSQGQLAIAD